MFAVKQYLTVKEVKLGFSDSSDILWVETTSHIDGSYQCLGIIHPVDGTYHTFQGGQYLHVVGTIQDATHAVVQAYNSTL